MAKSWLKFLVQGFIPPILEILITVLGDMAQKTESKVDDALVKTLSEEKDQIAEEIYKLL